MTTISIGLLIALFAVLAAFDVIGAVILWALLKSPQPQQEVSPAC